MTEQAERRTITIAACEQAYAAGPSPDFTKTSVSQRPSPLAVHTPLDRIACVLWQGPSIAAIICAYS